MGGWLLDVRLGVLGVFWVKPHYTHRHAPRTSVAVHTQLKGTKKLESRGKVPPHPCLQGK